MRKIYQSANIATESRLTPAAICVHIVSRCCSICGLAGTVIPKIFPNCPDAIVNDTPAIKPWSTEVGISVIYLVILSSAITPTTIATAIASTGNDN